MIKFFTWVLRAARFPFYVFGLLVRSSVTVLVDIATPGQRMSAGIGRIPLRCRTEVELTMLANLISITPGTLTLAVQRDPPSIYVHDMYISDADELRAVIYDLEEHVLGVLRPFSDVVPLAGVDHSTGELR